MTPASSASGALSGALTRRTFLGVVGTAALAGVAPGALGAAPVFIPATARTRRTIPASWLPEPPPPEQLRALAMAAMDAARRAGADFADIRVGVQRDIDVPPVPSGIALSLTVGYGIRACVDGSWSFQCGDVLTEDAVAQSARDAVAGARAYASVNASLDAAYGRQAAAPWVPVPVATGEWRGPMDIDPFAVPIDDHLRLLGTKNDELGHLDLPAYFVVRGGSWRDDLRVFASTDGAMVTQQLVHGGSGYGGGAHDPRGGHPAVAIDAPGLEWDLAGGFERALSSDLLERGRAGIDDAIRMAELPWRPFTDVGRFPVVFDGASFAKLFGLSVSMALDGDRASGIERDAAGDSFLAPMDEILGASSPLLSPLLTVRSDRALPSPCAVRWDDDGVEAEPYTLIDRGRVVDYQTTRETAAPLASWYARRGQSLRSHGGCVASTPASLPMGSGGHVQIAPTTGRAGRDDLLRELTHGFYIRDARVGATPGLTNLVTAGDPNFLILEVHHGVPVARTVVTTRTAAKMLFGKNLVALGDAETLRTRTVESTKGIPWQTIQYPVTAPAALCKEVDIVGPLGVR